MESRGSVVRLPTGTIGWSRGVGIAKDHRQRRRFVVGPGRSSEAFGQPGALDRMLRDTGRALRRTVAAWETLCPGCRCRSDRTRSARAASPPDRVSPNIFGMYAFLSAPTPCSPVIAPPASMQYVEDLGGDLLGVFRLSGNRLVVADERMQVAVAGVKHVADAQARSRFQLADATEHLGQLRARHDAVLHVVVRRHAAHRRERRLASLPDAIALRLDRRRFRSSIAPHFRQTASTIDEQLVDFRCAVRRARR